MDAHKLQLKIYATPDAAKAVDPEAFIPVFHRWIKEHLLPELTIDVANYLHVPEGPGVVLIGHGADYFMDQGEGRLGLLARRTLHAASLLEADAAFGGKLKFATGELLFKVNDRLAAANDDASFAALKPELEALAETLYPGAWTLARVGGPKELLAVRIKSTAPAPLATLLDRAGGKPAADASLVTG